MLQAETLRPGDLSLLQLETWRVFQAGTPAFASPLLGPEFAQAVARFRDDAAVAVYSREGRTVGFLAHHRRPDGMARPIGATWSDYHALIGEPGGALTPADALSAAGLSAYRFTSLVDPDRRFEGSRFADHDAYRIVHDGDGEAYWEALRAASPKRFKNLRRLEHKLEREVGDITLSAPDLDPDAFEQLLSWKRDQFGRTGLHDVLGAAWSRTMMRTLFETSEGPLQGLMLTMRVNGRPVAGHFGVRQGAAYHPWIAAFDPELAAYSPGQIFMGRAILAMAGLGLASYDLSAGSEHYKKPFASHVDPVGEGTLRVAPWEGLRNTAWDLAERSLGRRATDTARRVRRRFDHIAASELSLGGRLQGMASALAARSLRLDAPEHAPAPATEAEG